MPSALILATLLSVSAAHPATTTDRAAAAYTGITTDSPETVRASPALSPEAVFHQPPAPDSAWLTALTPPPNFSPGMTVSSLDTSLVRAQNYDEDPTGGNLGQPTFAAPPIGMPFAQQGTVWPGTPLLAPNGLMGGPAPAATMRGVNGPQPFRFGWTSRFDVGYLPKEATSSGGTGQLGVFEFNSELRYTAPTPMQWIFSVAPQFNLRLWDGPTVPALPGDVYRLGADFQLTSPTWGPYTFELGFTPSLNTSFETSPTSDAWNFDGRGAVFLRASPQWMFALGAMFWDRVNNRVLPYAGVVYTPNEYVEIRALFPRADASLFIGTPWGVPQWLYIAGEYHMEAYEIERGAAVRDQFEIQDWRVVLGIRSEHAGMTSFLEGGWVFDRNAEFLNTAAPATFEISSGFIVRFGVRW